MESCVTAQATRPWSQPWAHSILFISQVKRLRHKGKGLSVTQLATARVSLKRNSGRLSPGLVCFPLKQLTPWVTALLQGVPGREVLSIVWKVGQTKKVECDCPWCCTEHFNRSHCSQAKGQRRSPFIVCCRSVAQKYTKYKVTFTCCAASRIDNSERPPSVTLCDPKDCGTPGFPVLHSLPEFVQTHVHWVSDAIQPSYPLPSPSLPPSPASALNLSQQSGSFPMSRFFASGSQSIAASVSVLSGNIQSWFPLGLTGLVSLQSKGLSRVFSSTTLWKHQFFGAQPCSWSNYFINFI